MWSDDFTYHTCFTFNWDEHKPNYGTELYVPSRNMFQTADKDPPWARQVHWLYLTQVAARLVQSNRDTFGRLNQPFYQVIAMEWNHLFKKKASVPFFLLSTVYIARNAYVFRLQDTMTNTPQEFAPVLSMGAYMPIPQLDSDDNVQYTTKSIWNNHPSACACTFFCLIYQLLLQVFCAPIPMSTTTTVMTVECRPLAMMIRAWTGHTASVQKSGPRTAKRQRTGPDWTDLGLVHGPGPIPVLDGSVLVLKVFDVLKDWSWTGPDQPFYPFDTTARSIVHHNWLGRCTAVRSPLRLKGENKMNKLRTIDSIDRKSVV